MASIKCTNCGAILKTKDEIPVGKKVKCPKCTQPFVVQAEEPAPPREEAGGADPFAFGDNAENSPKKGKSSSNPEDGGEPVADGDGKPKKKNTTMIVLIVVGVLLLCCCCPGIGTGVYAWLVGFGTAVVKDGAKDVFKDAFKDAPKDAFKDMPKDFFKDFKK